MSMDTSEDMRLKQIEIILSKSGRERAMMGIDMIDSTYEIVRNSIISKMSQGSAGEITAQLFYRYYKYDFPPQTIEEVMSKIIAFALSKKR